MADTITMLDLVRQDLPAPRFFTSLFTVPRNGFFRSKKVTYDVIRNGAPIAVAVKSLASPANLISTDDYTSKTLEPPILREGGVIDSDGLMDRRPGKDPYQDPEYMLAIAEKSNEILNEVGQRFQRTIELECAQALTTGKVTLLGVGGMQVIEIDFQPDATLYAKTGTTWSANGTNIMSDMETWCDRVAKKGYIPKKAVIGKTARQRFVGNAEVQKMLNLLRLNVGQVGKPGTPLTNSMVTNADGSVSWGVMLFGPYALELISYDGFYKHPSTGQNTSYMPDDAVLILGESDERHLLFGACPSVAPPDPRVLPYLSGARIASAEKRIDMWPNGSIAPSNQAMTIEASCRPLPIPKAIDSFGCFSTTQ